MTSDLGVDPEALPRPLRRDAEENRHKILAAARDLFAERGLDATLDDIAQRAGVGVGTVYRKYACRELLVDALFEEAVEELTDIVREAMAGREPWDALVWFLEQACARMAADRGLRQIVLESCDGRPRISRARDQLEPLMAQLVLAARTEGRLRPDFEVADLPPMIGMLLHLVDEIGEVRPDLWRRYLALLLDALVVERSATSALPVPALTTQQLGELHDVCVLKP